MVREYPEELLLERVFFYTVKIMQRGHGSPADENGARHVFVGEIENLFQLFPIKNFFERQRFHGRARDDHAVEMFVSDVVEFFVKAVEMCRGGIFTLIGIGVQERDVDLQRRIGQKAHKLRFRFHFRGHEIQNSDFKRTDILLERAFVVHDENIFTYQS